MIPLLFPLNALLFTKRVKLFWNNFCVDPVVNFGIGFTPVPSRNAGWDDAKIYYWVDLHFPPYVHVVHREGLHSHPVVICLKRTTTGVSISIVKQLTLPFRA